MFNGAERMRRDKVGQKPSMMGTRDAQKWLLANAGVVEKLQLQLDKSGQG